MTETEFDNRIKASFSKVKEDIVSLMDRQKAMQRAIDELRDLIRQQGALMPNNHPENGTRLNSHFLNPAISPAEKKVLGILSDGQIPLEYTEIARRLDLNVITIRRYISNLVRYGVPLNIQKNLFNRNVVSLKRRPEETVA